MNINQDIYQNFPSLENDRLLFQAIFEAAYEMPAISERVDQVAQPAINQAMDSGENGNFDRDSRQNPSTKRPKGKKFTPEEDQIIRDGKRAKLKNSVIASRLPGRTKDQVYNRWDAMRKRNLRLDNQSTSDFQEIKFTPEEDQVIIEHKLKNTKVKDIVPFLPGKTELQIHFRWNYLKNRGPHFKDKDPKTRLEKAGLQQIHPDTANPAEQFDPLSFLLPDPVVKNLLTSERVDQVAQPAISKAMDSQDNGNFDGDNRQNPFTKGLRGRRFTREDDQVIIEAKLKNAKVKDIVLLLPGRTGGQIHGRWNYLKKRWPHFKDDAPTTRLEKSGLQQIHPETVNPAEQLDPLPFLLPDPAVENLLTCERVDQVAQPAINQAMGSKENGNLDGYRRQNPFAKGLRGRRFTLEEDGVIIKAKLNNTEVNDIVPLLPGRTKMQIHHRWSHLLKLKPALQQEFNIAIEKQISLQQIHPETVNPADAHPLIIDPVVETIGKRNGDEVGGPMQSPKRRKQTDLSENDHLTIPGGLEASQNDHAIAELLFCKDIFEW